jgi:adenylate cyclase
MTASVFHTARGRLLKGIIASVTLLSAAFGALMAPHTLTGLIGGLISGGLIGFVLVILETYSRDNMARELRRIPRPLLFVIRTLVYGAAFVLIPKLVLLVIRHWDPAIDISTVMNDNGLLIAFGFAFLVNFFMALRRMLGIKNLVALALGRYHRPREEERIVAFLDLKGSTPLAERMGTARYHDFLNEVFFDLSEPILASGGDVYQYVGDEVVVTWKAERGLRNGDCVRFLFAVEDALAGRGGAYIAQYGAAPTMRGALHIGPLMVGEIGDLKRQIVMIGDTMNTTSRIEGACRKFGRDHVASASLLVRMAGLPAGIRADSLGPVALAGKAGEMELFALERVAEGEAAAIQATAAQ